MDELRESWERLSLAAAKAYIANDIPSATDAWRRAAALCERLPPDDPRQAAACSNRSLADHLSGERDPAKLGWAKSTDLWLQAEAGIAELAVESRARSSHFHFRLEQRHRKDYLEAGRQRLQRILAGAAAVSQFNLAVAQTPSGSPADFEAARAAIDVRTRAWGARNPEAAEMKKLLASLAKDCGRSTDAAQFEESACRIAVAPARSALEIWQQESRAAKGRERDYLAACRMTLHLRVRALPGE